MKPLTVLLNGFRLMLLNTERKTFHFLDLIHQTMSALNFNKLSVYTALYPRLSWISQAKLFGGIFFFYSSCLLRMPLMS